MSEPQKDEAQPEEARDEEAATPDAPAASPEPAPPAPAAPPSGADSSGGGAAALVIIGLILVGLIVAAIATSEGPVGKGSTDPKGGESPSSKTLAEVQPLIEEAVRSFKEGREDEALQFLRQAQRRAPDAAETNAELGAFLARMGRFGEALPHLAAARERAPERSATARDYAICLARLGRTDEACQQIAEAIKLDQQDARNYLEAARIHLEALREAQAIVYLELLLAMDGSHKEALALMAEARSRTGQPALAAEVLDRLLALEPDSLAVAEAWLESKLEAGAGREALSDLEARFAADPKPANARILARVRALFPESLGAAGEPLAAALEAAPGDPELTVDLARIEVQQRKYEAAEARLAPLLEAPSTPLPAIVVAAHLARLRRQETKAAQLYERIGDRAPMHAHLGLLSVWRENRRYDRAIDHIGALRKGATGEGKAELAALMAQVFHEAGRPYEALSTFQDAVQRGAGKPSVFWSWALALLVEGRPDEAVRTLGQALPSKSMPSPDRDAAKDKTLLWRGIAAIIAGDAKAAESDLRAVAASSREDLPQAAWRAMARHLLGEVSVEELRRVSAAHERGPFFDNDRLFIEAFALERAGEVDAALARYKEAREASIGDEAPARLIDARAKALLTTPAPDSGG